MAADADLILLILYITWVKSPESGDLTQVTWFRWLGTWLLNSSIGPSQQTSFCWSCKLASNLWAVASCCFVDSLLAWLACFVAKWRLILFFKNCHNLLAYQTYGRWSVFHKTIFCCPVVIKHSTFCVHFSFISSAHLHRRAEESKSVVQMWSNMSHTNKGQCT